MLTFEKILQVFDEILKQDPLYEVVQTNHGYTLLAWQPSRSQWYSAELLETPEAMLDALLDAYTSFREMELTDGERDMTAAEKAQIKAECDALTERCEKEAAICSS